MTTALNLKHLKEQEPDLITNTSKLAQNRCTLKTGIYSSDAEIPCHYGNRSFTTAPLEAFQQVLS
jgi:hypothetical protein